jgi:cellulose biosynthesis protein BcsQ
VSVPTIAFFNNKGGVGKTSLVYHLAWMFDDLGESVVAADLDPQANLTAAFLDVDRLEEVWADGSRATVYGCLEPLIAGTGDIRPPQVEPISASLGLLVGDLSLSVFEDELSAQWPQCMDRKERAFRVVTAFSRTLQAAAADRHASLILVDVGPNLGAINRAALVASDYVAVPLSPDLFSLQGLRNLGPALRRWRAEWRDRRERNPIPAALEVPDGGMNPVGYVVLQHALRLDRPVRAYEKWIARIPREYLTSVLDQTPDEPPPVESDGNCLAMLKHYRNLMPLAQEARKPMFHLKPADGALGAHLSAAARAREDFLKLAKTIAKRARVHGDYQTGSR